MIVSVNMAYASRLLEYERGLQLTKEKSYFVLGSCVFSATYSVSRYARRDCSSPCAA